MANRVPMNKTISTKRRNSGLLEIAPFVLARQYSPINNAYWVVSNGATSGANWSVKVTSSTNIPADARSFPVSLRVYIDGKSAGGSGTRTAWKVVSVTDNGDNTLTLVLSGQNSASKLNSDKLGSPVNGILRRGTPNVNNFEKFCAEMPGYINWHDVPFWFETTRTTMCRSTLYDKWRKLALENPLYREYGDLDEIQKNKQLAADWMRRVVDTAFWGKALPYQNALQYDLLDEIDSFDGSSINLGVDGGKCIGRRANLIGIYEQLAECNRVVDLQNTQLNLPALFNELYNMMRVRESAGSQNPRVFDLFTDSQTAHLFNQAMIAYYSGESQNTLRLVMPVDGNSLAKKAQYGFTYRSYELFFPQAVVINVVSHYYFDDWITAAGAASNSMSFTARVLWVLDFAGIYPGIVASKEKRQIVGDIDNLSKINSDFACVMETNTQEQMLRSMTWSMIVECPAANLILEGLSNQVPEPSILGNNQYPGTTTTTTTTTPAPYPG
jgi:hypothetical protein